MSEPQPTLCTACGHPQRNHIQVHSTGHVNVPCFYGDCSCRLYMAPRTVVTK
jgi:hypothetical protein